MPFRAAAGATRQLQLSASSVTSLVGRDASGYLLVFLIFFYFSLFSLRNNYVAYHSSSIYKVLDHSNDSKKMKLASLLAGMVGVRKLCSS